MNNVAFIYHVNFNHLSLTFEQRENYIRNFDYLLNKINFPVTLSIFGEDLMFLNIRNPKALGVLKKNQNIRLFIPQYSHMLPYMFKEFLYLQINIGKKIINHLRLAAKMTNILYTSEVDYLSPAIWPDLCTNIEGMVVGETRIKIDGVKSPSYPSIFTTTFNKKPISIYLSRKKFLYKDQLHKFLRDEIKNSQMNNAIFLDIDNYAKQEPLIARIDLEVLILNTLSSTNMTFVNRIDKWAKYMKSLNSVGINAIFLDDIKVSTVPKIDENLLSRDIVEDFRWNNAGLYHILKIFDYSKLNPEKKVIFLSLLCSDYFCTNLKDFVFNTSYGKITICKTRKFKDLESSLKIRLLNDQKIEVLVKDSNLTSFFETFLKVVERIKILI